jgi:hypothetical protein
MDGLACHARPSWEPSSLGTRSRLLAGVPSACLTGLALAAPGGHSRSLPSL